MQKLLIFLTNEKDKNKYEVEPISSWLNEISNEGVIIDFVVDTSLDSNDNPDITPRLRMEKEGPEWATYNDETLEKVKDADMILVGYNGVNSKLLEVAEKLKFVGVLRSGVENVNIQECNKRGIIVSACPGRLGESVSDFTVATILGINRFLSRDDLSKRSGWKYPNYDSLPRALLMKDSTIGLVGFGAIGRLVAHKLKNFNCRIVAYDPFVSKEEGEKEGVEILSLDELMKEADFISVHARLTDSTRGMIGAHEISLMKNSAYFINTARAGLVDENALVQALKDHKIRGAALDVFAHEPLSDDDPIRSLDNVLLSPHNAGGAGNLLNVSMEIMKDDFIRYLRGDKVLNQMNKF